MSRGIPPPARGLPAVQGDALEFLQARYRLWNEGGTEAMLRASWAPDIVYHDPPDFPDATTKVGAVALAEHLNARLEAVPGAKFELVSAWWVDPGTVVLVELSLRVGGQTSGVELEDVPVFHLIRLAGETRQVVELSEFTNVHQALEAAGLPE